MPLELTDDKSTLVQVMAWCRQATSHYLSQRWPRSMSPNGVTRPQWVECKRPLGSMASMCSTNSKVGSDIIICQVALSHYLNQHCFIINEILLHEFIWSQFHRRYLSGYNAFETTICKISVVLFRPQCVNSLWPSDTIWQHEPQSTLVQVIACCLMASSHYLNQC